MANNSNRKAIEFMVQGALPPHSTNVLWMDTSVPTLPVLKIFENGAWTACHTESSKEIDMLVQAVENLTETNNSQSKAIVDLTDEIKNLSDWEGREQERDEAISDFRTTLMGNKGEVRIRPLVAAKIVNNGEEHCGFMAQVSDEDKQMFYDGVNPDARFMFTATKSEGLLSATEGQISSFPLGVKMGAEAFYPAVDWHVCTEAPQDITSAASTWQTAVIQVGEVWRCKEEHKYYNSSDEYIGSVYVYEKVGQGEVTLDDIKEISKDILYSVENIDTSTLAKQGSNPNATLSATQAAVNSLSPIVGAAAAYNTGKEQLAANLEVKGVHAEATESLPELAEKVLAISHEQIIMNDGDIANMYAKQLYGALDTPNYWNLYHVLNDLLNDGRLLNYGGIVLAEYNKGYDSISVQGADAFVFSDIVDGQYELYDESISTTHVWNDADNGKINRWVAYCFVSEDSNFNILDTNTSPRSIFIGRKIGTITLNANSRTSEIIVPDGNKLGNIDSKTYTFQFSKKTVIRNLENQVSGKLLYEPNNVLESLYIEGDKLSNVIVLNPAYNTSNDSVLSNITLVSPHFDNCYIFGTTRANIYLPTLNNTIIKGSGKLYFTSQSYNYFNNLKTITVIAEDITFTSKNLTALNSTVKFYLQYMTNDKSKSVVITEAYESWKNIEDLELQDGWCKPVDISKLKGLTEANMYAHILQRLKQDEPDCGDGVTIVLGQTNIDKLTSNDNPNRVRDITLLNTLIGTYGYAFPGYTPITLE